MDSSMCFAVRLRNTSIWVSAPALSKERAESYSEFVPGKDGMKTLGLALPVLGEGVQTDETGCGATTGFGSVSISGFVG